MSLSGLCRLFIVFCECEHGGVTGPSQRKKPVAGRMSPALRVRTKPPVPAVAQLPPLPPVPPLPPLPEGPRESWWERNFAALLAALIVASFGLVATLNSAQLNSATAQLQTAWQASAARQQSREEFQRSQEKEAYTALITSVLKLEDVELGLRPQNLRAPVDTSPGSTFADDAGKWQAANSDFLRSVAAVQLVGSREIREQVGKLQDAHFEVMNAYIGVFFELEEPKSDPKKVAEAIKNFDAKVRERTMPRIEFTSIARADLGIQ